MGCLSAVPIIAHPATGETTHAHQTSDPASKRPSVTSACSNIHIMLIDVTSPLAIGQTVPLRLRFERAGVMTLDVPVVRRSANGPPANARPVEAEIPREKRRE